MKLTSMQKMTDGYRHLSTAIYVVVLSKTEIPESNF
jgi:hypothetical protein